MALDSSLDIWLTVAQFGALGIALALAQRPLGDWVARTFDRAGDSRAHDSRIERGIYRLLGVDPDSEQSWPVYLRAVIVFSLIGVLLLYVIQRIQAVLPASLGLPAVPEGLAFNTAVSFVTNTNWQSYSPETTMSLATQAGGLAVQNFLSAAVGIAVAVALVRGFARRSSTTIGNFWVDVVRATGRILLPLSVVAAVILMVGGVAESLNAFTTVHTLAGGTQQVPGGLVASQEAIKELGNNGGGYFNANSAHPLENPTAWTNLLEITLLLLVPFSLPRAFGVMVGDPRQGRAILVTMVVLFTLATALMVTAEFMGGGSATRAAGAAMEGKETRFGIGSSAIFATATTLTSTGAVDAAHDSLTPFGGGVAMFDMMLGEIAPGGVGAGLYGILMLAVITVFISGLLVGRTPEYLGKRLGPREMKLASIYILITPALALAGTGLSFAIPAIRADVEKNSMLNTGAHGFGEVLYAFTSAANNNGSAFGGLSANTVWLDSSLTAVMLLGRFLPIVMVLALAGALAGQGKVPATAGTFPTHRPMFVVLLLGVTLIVVALTYLPVLALGPISEGLR